MILKVSYTASGVLNDASRYPHFAAAREYLAGALRLDAAALALRARMEDPAVAVALDSKPELLLGHLAPHHLAVRVPCHLQSLTRGCLAVFKLNSTQFLPVHLRVSKSVFLKQGHSIWYVSPRAM